MKKKILPILMSAALAFAMPITSLAATPRDLTQTEKDEIVAAHNYKAYQILVGDSINANNEIGNIAFGTDFETVRADLAATLGIPVTSNAKDFAEAIHNYTDAEALAAVIAKAVDKDNGGYSVTDADKKINGVGATYTVDGKEYTLAVGYYLVVDITEGLTGDDAVYVNRSQLQVVKAGEAIDIQAKLNAITSEKKVKDINDSKDEAYSDWQDSADYDIGDEISFKISATVPDDYDYYNSYTYVFTDNQSVGLTFKRIDKVTVDGTEITKGFELATDDEEKPEDFTVTFANLKSIAAIHAGSEIAVEYTSILNENAVLGATGNPNEMYVEFENDKGGKGKTPKDTVIVFTYKTEITKKDQDQQPLDGAMFSLEKYILATDSWKEIDLDVTATQFDDGKEVKNIFSAAGLDDGLYRIQETDTPDGYNTIDPIYFEVVAAHVTEADMPTLTSLAATGYEVTGTDLDSGNIGVFTCDLDTGAIDTDVINQKGVVLPSTGGIGTTIFYVIGGVLVVGAVVLLIVRRRMKTEEE